MFTQTAPPGFGSVAGTPAANASGARLEEEFQRGYSNDDELDERTKNQSTDGTKTDFEGEITTGGVSVSSGANIKHGGTPVAGYLQDGTAFFRKIFTGTITSGNNTKSVAHGLGNIYTDSRLKGMSAWFDRSGLFEVIPNTDGSPSITTISQFQIDDTNVKWSRNSGVSGTIDCTCVIDYIL